MVNLFAISFWLKVVGKWASNPKWVRILKIIYLDIFLSVLIRQFFIFVEWVKKTSLYWDESSCDDTSAVVKEAKILII